MMRLTRSLLTGALLAVAAGCEPGYLPDPRVLSVSPEQMLASEAITLEVTAELVLPFYIDYDSLYGDADTRVSVLLGELSPLRTRALAHGMISVFIPSGLPPATYDVSIRLADGRTGTLPGGFTVLPGLWPSGYTIDPINDQRSGQQFPITIRAQGTNAPSFNGTVTVSCDLAGLPRKETGRFQQGVRSEPVALTLEGGGSRNVSLTVTDAAGNSATSNTFRLLP